MKYEHLFDLDCEVLTNKHDSFKAKDGRTINYANVVVKLDDQLVKIKADPTLEIEAGSQTLKIGYKLDRDMKMELRVIGTHS
jgi:hypothetical protein